MQNVQYFFEGLTGPASLTFLGLLFGAFLIGVLPAGLAYATRVRKLKRRLAATRESLSEQRAAVAERDARIVEETTVSGKAREEVTVLKERVRLQNTEQQRLVRELASARAEAEQLGGTQLASQIEAKENAELVEKLRARINVLTAQVQGLQQANNARVTPAAAFDVNMAASLKATRSKMEGLERRLRELTADNERLRSKLLAS